MKKVFFISLFSVLLSLNGLFAADKFVVVIDAGHGGKDGGAVRGTYKEKEINLGVALTLGKLIEANMKDVKVVYTRKSDVFVDLYKRADIANKAKANLFISIHTNSTAAKVTTASGADTYILGLARSDENLAVAKRENSVILLEDNYTKRYEGFDPNSPESNILFEFMTNKYMDQSLEFATNVQSGFSKVAKRVDRGVAQAGFLVLRESGMPSVLIELGFINNPAEAKYLTSSIGQRAMASAIFNGFEKYKKEFDKKQGRITLTDNSSSDTKIKSTRAQQNEFVVENTTKADAASPVNNKNSKPVKVDNTSTSVNQQSQFFSKNNDVTKQTVEDKSDNRRKPTESPTRTVERTQTPTKKVQVEEEISNSIPAGVIEYRVQFLTSESKLSTNSSAFKGLSPVSMYKDGGVYKYTYGSTTNEIEAQRLQRQARVHFKDAFVVKFRNDARIK